MTNAFPLPTAVAIGGREARSFRAGRSHDWTRNSQISRFVRRVRYFCEDEIILAVQGTVRSADGSPKVVSGFEVDADKVEGFKAALKSIGIDNPEPKWLLAFEMNF